MSWSIGDADGTAGVSQSALSQHLAKMRAERLVTFVARARYRRPKNSVLCTEGTTLSHHDEEELIPCRFRSSPFSKALLNECSYFYHFERKSNTSGYD